MSESNPPSEIQQAWDSLITVLDRHAKMQLDSGLYPPTWRADVGSAAASEQWGLAFRVMANTVAASEARHHSVNLVIAAVAAFMERLLAAMESGELTMDSKTVYRLWMQEALSTDI